MPNALLKNHNLSDNAKMVYMGFAEFSDNDTGLTWVSRDKVAETLGKSLKTVKAGLTELYRSGWMYSKQRGMNKTAYRYCRLSGPVETKAKVRAPKRDRPVGTDLGPHNYTQGTKQNPPDGENVIPFKADAA